MTDSLPTYLCAITADCKEAIGLADLELLESLSLTGPSMTKLRLDINALGNQIHAFVAFPQPAS